MHKWTARTGAAIRTASAAVSHAPENAAYGLIALAPLGAAFGASAMLLTLVGATVANAVASSLGGGRLVSGARASLALLTAAFVSALLLRLGPDADPWTVLLLLAMAVALAGCLQATFGLLRFGGIVKYTPYPVRVGLTSGIGLLLLLTALPVTLGHGFGAAWSASLQPPLVCAALVGATAGVVAWGSSRWLPRLPASLLGLTAGTVLQALLGAGGWSEMLGPRLETPALPDALSSHLALAWSSLVQLPWRSVLPLIIGFSSTVAVLSSLDTLLAGSIVDGRLRSARDANRELVAQGLSNVAASIVGGQPASPSVPRSMVLIGEAQPRPHSHRHVVLWYAVLLGSLALAGPMVIGVIPASAIGGVLVAQALPMIAAGLWRTPLEIWLRRSKAPDGAYDTDPRRLMAANWAVGLAVTLGAVVLGLGPAVLLGASFAIILFVRANMRDVVRRSTTAESSHSLKMRTPAAADALRREGARIAVIELEGSLFFGTADALRVQLQSLPALVESAVLDLHQIQEIDVTAARILFETAEDWQRSGRRLLFAEWTAGDPRRLGVEAVAGSSAPTVLHFVDTTDLALEQCEDALLQGLGLADAQPGLMKLAQTHLVQGLEARELAQLAAELECVRFRAGDVMFRQGDPGDALYLSVQGDIGLRMPGSQRRLASFAPGVMVGEMAVLVHGDRSAEAVAESDVVAWRLSVDAFHRLKIEHPALGAKLLNNIALHLAGRVRSLTGDLSHWVARSAMARSEVRPALLPREEENEA